MCLLMATRSHPIDNIEPTIRFGKGFEMVANSHMCRCGQRNNPNPVKESTLTPPAFQLQPGAISAGQAKEGSGRLVTASLGPGTTQPHQLVTTHCI